MLFTPEGTGAVSQLLVNGATDGVNDAAQGALVIQGTVAKPVILESAADSPAAGDWQVIYFARTSTRRHRSPTPRSATPAATAPQSGDARRSAGTRTRPRAR